MASIGKPDSVLQLAADTFGECHHLLKHMETNGVSAPSMRVGSHSDLWNPKVEEIAQSRARVLGLLGQLTRLIQGPHEFLHEFVSANWDCGALYTALEFNVLEMIPLDGRVSAKTLAEASGLPEAKLFRILRLLVCKQILEEVEEAHFCHTAISEELLNDQAFKAYVSFQLFETRIASAHLADSLRVRPNSFELGHSAFRYAWGAEMYDWHARHQEKAARFGQGMQSVSKSLDPGNQLLHDWFSAVERKGRSQVVEIGGRYGYASSMLAETFADLSFEVRDTSVERLSGFKKSLSSALESRVVVRPQTDDLAPSLASDIDTTMAYVLRNVLWNWSDERLVQFLQILLPVLESAPETAILVCDGVSPDRSMFDAHVELAYRRRDVTMMTMHNVKQRTEAEWRNVFAQADPRLKVTATTASTSHVYKGLFELKLEVVNQAGNDLCPVSTTQVDGASETINGSA